MTTKFRSRIDNIRALVGINVAEKCVTPVRQLVPSVLFLMNQTLLYYCSNSILTMVQPAPRGDVQASLFEQMRLANAQLEFKNMEFGDKSSPI